MMDNFRSGATTMFIRLTTRFGQYQSFAGTYFVALTCAFMFASAFALPSFSSAALGLNGLYELTLGIFVCSAISFCWIHRIEIKDNVAPGLAVCLPIAVTALLTVRPSPKDFAAYMPVSAAMGIMVIVHIVPWTRKVFRARNSLTVGDLIRAEHRSQSSGSDGASMGSDSIRSNGFSLWILNRFITSDPDPMVLAHLGHAGEYNLSTVPASWETISTGDLESGLHHGSSRTSTTSEDSTNPLLF